MIAGRLTCLSLGFAVGLAVLGAAPVGEPTPDPAPGFATITEDDLRAEVELLASEAFEGRDSPSQGLSRAAEHIAARLEAAGFVGAGPSAQFLIPFTRRLPQPVAEDCALVLLAGTPDDQRGSRRQSRGDAAAPPAEELTFALGTDFVPVWQAGGQAEGEVVVLGFGIDSPKQKYDDIRGDVANKIAVIVQGEPRHPRKFDGPEVTQEADLYHKLKTLQSARVAGVLVVRRPPPSRDEAPPDVEPARLGFRYTWASWAGEPVRNIVKIGIVALEITPATAQAITGIDVLAAVAAVDRSAKAPKPIETGRRLRMAAKLEWAAVSIDNVVGLLPGSDPELADEYIVVGAHYDHVGVDPRGRIGLGADDNASGTAALLEIAEALGRSPPRRSILACAFAAEEDGLVGSRALAKDPPVPKQALAAMVNMDMLGRGDAKEVVAIGVLENPGFEKLLERANELQPTRIKTIVTRQGAELFQRSDHYSFHQIGVPSLFFFEGLPVDRNADYHTWRDTIDALDFDKLARSTRLVFNTVWLLANDDDRPPPPER